MTRRPQGPSPRWFAGSQSGRPNASPLHDVKHPQARLEQAHEFLKTLGSGQRRRSRRDRRAAPLGEPDGIIDPPHWWSQTGSNRRPPACKAGALPTELWPLPGPRGPPPQAWNASIRDGSHPNWRAGPIRDSPVPKWWAWDDSNVRPHPYQGCALTT